MCAPKKISDVNKNKKVTEICFVLGYSWVCLFLENRAEENKSASSRRSVWNPYVNICVYNAAMLCVFLVHHSWPWYLAAAAILFYHFCFRFEYFLVIFIRWNVIFWSMTCLCGVHNKYFCSTIPSKEFEINQFNWMFSWDYFWNWPRSTLRLRNFWSGILNII